jgi:hypothetical protein
VGLRSVVALLGAGTSLGCAPLIGLDELTQVDCATTCQDEPADASRRTTTTGRWSTGTITGSSSSGTTWSSGAGGMSGVGGAGGAGTGGAGRDAGGGVDAGSGGSSVTEAGSDGGVVLGEELIDPIEDNLVPHLILTSHGRTGYWFSDNDGTLGGTQSPPAAAFQMSAGGPNGSTFAARLAGHGFTNWGIYMGFTLNKTPTGFKNSYDARAYKGITFWAKLGATDMCTPASSCHLLRFSISTRDTDRRGGVCTVCNDHFGSWQTLTTTWQKYTILFADLAQEGWGSPGPANGTTFDSSRTYEVHFQAKPAGNPFDFWIDDVSFVLR